MRAARRSSALAVCSLLCGFQVAARVAAADEASPPNWRGYGSRRHLGKELPGDTGDGLAPSQVQDFGLEPELWSGMDAGGEPAVGPAAVDHGGGGRRASLLGRGARKDGRRILKVVGLFNTGTNLLETLLEENFPGAFALEEYGSPVVYGRCRFWKHMSLSMLQAKKPDVLKDCHDRGAIVVAMVRNPLAWLSSMDRKPYTLESCREAGQGRRGWRTPCMFADVHHLLRGEAFKDIETIWALWTHDYDNLSELGFDKALAIRYEDLLVDTEGFMRKIARLASLPMPARVVRVEKQVSPYLGRGRADAIAKVQNRTYLSDFTAGEVLQACTRLDQDAMARHGYGDCDAVLRGAAG